MVWPAGSVAGAATNAVLVLSNWQVAPPPVTLALAVPAAVPALGTVEPLKLKGNGRSVNCAETVLFPVTLTKLQLAVALLQSPLH